MTTRTVPDLKELFKQAAEIAQQVPPSMQEAAFNRAIDLLTGNNKGPSGDSGGRSDAPHHHERSGAKLKAQKPSPSDAVNGPIDALLQTVDSTQHPAVVSAKKHLDRALMVLKIALDEQSIDGLSPSDIARVLREKFRVSAADNAVAMALSRASTLVDRVKRSEGYVYRIMAPGNTYLASLNSGEVAGTSRRPARKKLKKVIAKTVAPQTDNRPGAADAVQQKVKTKQAHTHPVAKRGSGGLAPKAAVITLIADGYFGSPRTGLAVQEYLKTKRGYTIGTAQLRLAMLRLVREQQLEREANANGEYEYKRK